MKIGIPRLNQRGVTLVELTIALGIGGVVALVFMTVTTALFSGSAEIMGTTETQSALYRANYALQQTIGMAVNLTTTTSALEGAAIGAPPAKGMIRDTLAIDRFTANGGAAGDTTTIGLFLRETGGKDDLTRSVLGATGIFYQRPTPTTSGVLFIDMDNQTGVRTVAPDYGKFYFDKLVEFSIAPQLNNAVVTAVEITLVSRAFNANQETMSMNWCPQWDIDNATAGCTAADLGRIRFRDIRQVFRIAIPNQIVNDSNPLNESPTPAKERLLGRTYLFPFRIP